MEPIKNEWALRAEQARSVALMALVVVISLPAVILFLLWNHLGLPSLPVFMDCCDEDDQQKPGSSKQSGHRPFIPTPERMSELTDRVEAVAQKVDRIATRMDSATRGGSPSRVDRIKA